MPSPVVNGLHGVVQLQERLGPVLDEQLRKEQLDKSYSILFATIAEEVLGAPGLSMRQRVLSEMSLPHVVMLEDMNEGTVEQILKRASVRLTRDLQAEMPDAGIERVVLEKNGSEGPHLRVVGVPEAAPEHAAVVARARALWDEPGQPLTAIHL